MDFSSYYNPTLPTGLAAPFFTLLPLVAHGFRTLLSDRMGLSRWPRLFLAWASLAALIVGDTTQPPLVGAAGYMRMAVPAPYALLAAAVAPAALLALDEAMAWFGRRRRRNAAVDPMARWGEAVLTTAVGMDLLCAAQAVAWMLCFPNYSAATDSARSADYKKPGLPLGMKENIRASDEYWYLDREDRILLALARGEWRQVVGHALTCAMLVPGWLIAHMIFEAEPDALNMPIIGGLMERIDGHAAGRPRVRKDSEKISNAAWAVSLCMMIWGFAIWRWWAGGAF